METTALSPSKLADLAEGLRQERRIGEAMEAVEQCLKVSPQHPRALLILGRLWYQNGMLLQALERFKTLESLLGKDQGLKNITTGLKQLQNARSSRIDPAFVTESMAGLLVQQGYLLEAMEIYRQLYLASEHERRLWEEILLLKERLEKEGSRETQKERVDRELETLDLWIQKQNRGV